MSDDKFATAVERIRKVDARYGREAYAFMNDAVAYTVKKWKTADPGRKTRHVSAGELISGTIELAVREFGVLAPYVFSEWGITSGPAIGDIVFHLIREGIMSASSDDSREDFNVVGSLAPLFPDDGTCSRPQPPPKID